MYSADQLCKFELSNSYGVRVELLNWGARVASIKLPTTAGARDVVVGYNDLDEFLGDRNYLGCTLGRYAGRIANAHLHIEGHSFELSRNEEHACLHGGHKGFDKQFWQVSKPITNKSVSFNYHSKDREEGFPGALDASVTYTLKNDLELHVEYQATTDKPGVINLSNHSYFNLSSNEDINDHEIAVYADSITVQNRYTLPQGNVAAVKSTALDLRQPTRLGTRKFDQNYVLNKLSGEPELAASAYSKTSGIGLELYTTKPGLQFYTGDYLQLPIMPRAGFCFEPQHFPDAPNQAGFPSALLLPGHRYKHHNIYRFSLHNV